MENINQKKIVTKSPGKSLLSGGYLILDKSKRGLVINTDTYMSCESNFQYKKRKKSENNYLSFTIHSEYLNETFNYISYFEKIKTRKEKTENINELKIIEKNNKNNKWIQNCIISSLLFYLTQNDNLNDTLFNKNKEIEINVLIKSDYRFFSYSKENLSKNIKTGLGSSSALISSLTSNLILLYQYLLTNKKNKEKIIIKEIDDKIIQSLILGACLLSNNLSQNKIGSCYDIISVLFGSQVFIQSQKNIFINSPFNLNNENKILIKDFTLYLRNEYIPNILFLNEDNHLLKNNICFISIEMGSDTRIFVKKVLEYANNKKTNKLYDDELFSNLNDINEQIINIFINNLNNKMLLKELCKKYRNILRLISKESKVDIEPEILTPLLNRLIFNEKIIYSICPGAGGYDSIIIIGKDNINKEELNQEIKKIINEFNDINKDKLIKAYLLDANLSKNFGTIIEY